MPLFYLFLSCIYIIKASGINFISPYGGDSVTGVIGSSVQFKWSFSAGVKRIEWGLKRSGQDEFESNGVLVSVNALGNVVLSGPSQYTGRVNGSADYSSGRATFVLRNITKGDKRSYGGQIIPVSGRDFSQFDPVNLLLKEPPVITLPRLAQESHNEGRSVSIDCRATGIPEPDVMWIHNGQVKSSGSKTAQLTLSPINRADAGTYICKANNSVGTREKQLTLVVNYAATIRSIFSSSSKSWIGQTVTMRCESDGFPTPVLTWYSPGGNRFTPVRDKENTVHVPMSSGKDFGLYICTADNGFVPASQTVRVQQIKAPGSLSITSTAADVHATSLTVKWTAPTDDGGSPITAYRVVILQGRNVTRKINITDPAAREFFFGGLNRNTYYNVTAYARNFVFEGEMSQATMKTKFAGVPFATDITCLPVKTKETNVTIQWNEANNNGAPIVRYTLYQRSVSVDSITQDWGKVSEKRDPLARQVAVQLERGKEYEFFVTATNAFGESLREDTKIANITVLGDVPGSVTMSAEVMHDEITLKWEEPENNGAAITQYSVHQRTGNDQRWRKLEDLLDIAKREYVVSMQKNKAYEFVVTATNKYGEGPKGSVTVVLILGGTNNPQEKKSGVLGSSRNLDAAYISLITVLVIVIIILSVLLWRLRHRPCPRCAGELIAMNPLALPVGDNTEYPSVAKTAAAVTCATPAKGDYMPLHPSGRSWEISREQVEIIKVIGKGAFSQVAQGKVGDLRGNQENTIVAIKMLKANAPQSDQKDLLSELELMKKLKPHPHVIKLMGCVTWSDPLMVLIEYVPFGDLLGYLRKSRGLNDTYYKDPDVKPQTSLTAEQLMKFAWQVADGMCYLSSKKIIHRDLAARNVLVGEGEMCKVTDFGMARNVHQDDIYTRKSRGRLPVKWTAYEALLYGTYTTQSDVWSYGVLLYEILTVGGSPYPTIKAREIAAKIQEGYRMPKPSHVDEKLYQIMLRCWEENPDERPTFEKLRKTMKDMERNHMTYVNLTQYDDSLYTNITDFADD